MPFSAVAGNESAKTAVKCLLANPNLNCMLITGPAGTGKTLLTRSIGSLDKSIPVVSAPIGISDDRLFGSIDIEKAVTTGDMEIQPGLFAEAKNGVICIDEIELMDLRLALQCVECAVKKQVNLEREGLSAKYPTNARIIATTSSPMFKINGHLKDRFDISVRLSRPEFEDYVASLRNNLEFSEGELDLKQFRSKDREVLKQIKAARKALPTIRVLKKHKDAISRICRKYGVIGQRGPVAAAEVAATLAALDGRKKTSQEDVILAVELCLTHRRTKFEPKKKKGEEELPRGFGYAGSKRFIHDDRRKRIEATLGEKINEKVNLDNIEEVQERPINEPQEIETKVGEKFETIDIMESADANGAFAETKAKKYIESPMGRYTAFRIPMGQCTDLAIDATIRAAAPYQRVRGKKAGEGMKIEKNDLREKIRTKHTEQTFIFMMDTSGSLIIRNRMAKVKAAIISMLETHYLKRDRVGLYTFNDEKTEILMPPTRAIDELSSTIDGIVVGCGTPLSKALIGVWDFIKGYQKKHPEEIVHIILFSDGKATTPLEEGNDPVEEALEIAEHLEKPNVDWTVIDSGLGSSKSDIPVKLAQKLKGRFFLLDDLQSKDTVSSMWGDSKPKTQVQPYMPTAYDILEKRGLR